MTDTQPRICGDCGEVIEGQVLLALQKTWHPDHFKCTECQTVIGSGSFLVKDDKPYCEDDYHKLFSPKCESCNDPIRGKYVSALDKTWHPEHFVCTECHEVLAEDGFHTQNDLPYCRRDYLNLFAPKCDGCGEPLTQSYLSALGKRWHQDCFVCSQCQTPIQGSTFHVRDEQPVCQDCFRNPARVAESTALVEVETVES